MRHYAMGLKERRSKDKMSWACYSRDREIKGNSFMYEISAALSINGMLCPDDVTASNL